MRIAAGGLAGERVSPSRVGICTGVGTDIAATLCGYYRQFSNGWCRRCGGPPANQEREPVNEYPKTTDSHVPNRGAQRFSVQYERTASASSPRTRTSKLARRSTRELLRPRTR